jgi:methionyl-tRNA formyltransferase
MATKIVFLGSKPIGYRCLQYLLNHKDVLNIEIVGLRTRLRTEFGDGNDLSALAEEYKIPLIDSLDEIPECDIIYSVQHHELLKASHIQKAAKIAVNLHLAPLPEYRGCNQFSFAIMDEVKEFGVSIHEIDTRIDHGSLLFEERFSMPENCWVNDLYELTFSAAIRLFETSISDLIQGKYAKIPQSELLKTRKEHLHFRNEIQQLKQIDLNESAGTIEKTIRATYMPGFEPPFALIGNKKIYFQIED